MGSKERNRLSELDGLRGWAALSVVIFHVFWESLGVRFPIFRNPFTAGLMNGTLAVCIFFVVSGAALSAPFFQSYDRKVVLLGAIKRYPRLTLPILVATLVTVSAGYFGLLHGSEAASLLGRTDWLGLNNPAQLSLGSLVRFAFFEVYLGPSTDNNILPFLWTMPIEMLGSVVLFLYLALHNMLERPLLFLVFLYVLILMLSPFLACFLAGAFLTGLRVRGITWSAMHRGAIAAVSVLIALIASSVLNGDARPSGDYICSLMAVGICFVVTNNPSLRSFLAENPVSRFLGKISFSIYLVQYLSLNAVLAWWSIHTELTVITAFAIGMATLASSIVLATIFLPIETVSHVVSRWLAKSVVAGMPRRRADCGTVPSRIDS